MIRRISKKNDLKDIITAKQPNVISNVDWIGYFIQGYPDNIIEPQWSVSGEVINVYIPTDLLETLTNGILMRKVNYRVENSDYPDGHYDLEIEDNMNIWLGDEQVDKGEDGSPYITESELNQTLTQTLSTYATMPWVSSTVISMTANKVDLSLVSGMLAASSRYATQSWVENTTVRPSTLNSYLNMTWSDLKLRIQDSLDSYFVTFNWLNATGVTRNYLSSQLSSYATQSWVSSNFATIPYVSQKIVEMTEHFLTTQTLKDYMLEEGYMKYSEMIQYVSSQLNPYVQMSLVSGMLAVSSTYATQSWVEGQNYLTAVSLDGYATQSWVSSTVISMTANKVDMSLVSSMLAVSSTYATQSWVEGQNYLTAVSLDGYATQSWVSSTVIDMTAHKVDLSLVSGMLAVSSQYASQTWVINTTVRPSTISVIYSKLSSYATQSWVSSNYTTMSEVKSYLNTEEYITKTRFLDDDYKYMGSYVSMQLSRYATQSWVTDTTVRPSILSSILSSYATQSWVEGQNYLTAVSLDGYATQSWVSSTVISMTANKVDLSIVSGMLAVSSTYATQSWVEMKGYPQASWVTGYVSSALSTYALKTDIPSLSTYATQSWVEMKGYPQASWVTGYVQSYVSSALSTYSYTETDPTVPSWAKSATKPTYTASEVSALGLSQIWTGTSTEWAALTSDQQAIYTIALITE